MKGKFCLHHAYFGKGTTDGLENYEEKVENFAMWLGTFDLLFVGGTTVFLML